MNTSEQGFTITELIVAIVLLLLIGTLVLLQNQEITKSQQDSRLKTSVNAIHYNLKELYYPTNQSYPEKLGESTLKGLDPALLKDYQGRKIGEATSALRYEPLQCQDGKCKSYTIRADLQKEADYIKDSRKN